MRKTHPGSRKKTARGIPGSTLPNESRKDSKTTITTNKFMRDNLLARKFEIAGGCNGLR